MARARTPTLGDEPIIAGALERSALRRHYPVHFRNEVSSAGSAPPSAILLLRRAAAAPPLLRGGAPLGPVRFAIPLR